MYALHRVLVPCNAYIVVIHKNNVHSRMEVGCLQFQEAMLWKGVYMCRCTGCNCMGIMGPPHVYMHRPYWKLVQGNYDQLVLIIS